MNKFLRCFFIAGMMCLPSIQGISNGVGNGFDFSNRISRKDAKTIIPKIGQIEFVMESDGLVSHGNSATLSILIPTQGSIESYVDEDGIVSDFRLVGKRAYIDVAFINSFNSGAKCSTIVFNCRSSVPFGHMLTEVRKQVYYYIYFSNQLNPAQRIISVSATSMDDAITLGEQNIFDDYTPVQLSLPKIKWTDRYGNVFPLAGAKIKVQYEGGFNRMIYTDDEGQFNLRQDPNLEYVISEPITQCDLVLANDNLRLYGNHNAQTSESDFVVSLNDYENEYSSENGLVITKNKFSTSFWEAVQVFEGFNYYTQYAKEQMTGEDIGYCSVYYSNFDGCSYSTLNNYIEIDNTKSSGADIQPYENWDVFGHEYGHYLGYNLKINGGDSVISTHVVQEDDVSYLAKQTSLYHANTSGVSLAWRESWPTYWSELAQNSFPDNIKADYANQYIADGIYESAKFDQDNYYAIDYYNENNGLLDCENKYGDDYNIGGDAYEIGLIRTLYKINREIGGYSENDIPNHDYLLDILKEVRNQTPHWNDDANAFKINDFGTFFKNLKNKVHQGIFENLTMEELSEILQSYRISPMDICFDANENAIFFKTSDEIFNTYLVKNSSSGFVDHVNDYITFAIEYWWNRDDGYGSNSITLTPERTEDGWRINNAKAIIRTVKNVISNNDVDDGYYCLSLQREQFEYNGTSFGSIIPLDDWFSLI